jgi:signal transduction histidine kinase
VTIATAADERWVTLTFADEGIGIPGHDLPKVFERFYRGDAARKTPGTGLGLSIVKTVIESHGGSLWVESGPGSGTQVTMTLPRP